MRDVLVTGAGGYIGSILTRELLSLGYRVVAVDRFLFGRDTIPQVGNGLRVIESDIRQLQQKDFRGVVAVIDLAAMSNDPSGELDPAATWSINHRGRVRVATLAKEAGVERYIFPSSCSVYGFQEGILDETSSVNPLTTYAEANLAAEQDVLRLHDDDFCVVVLRQATVYGLSYRMRFDLAINGMVKGFFQNGTIPILRDGTQWRPFIHVRDTSNVLAALVDVPGGLVNGQVFNVGSNEQNVQIMSLAQVVAESIGVPFEYEWYGDPDNRSYRVNFTKIHKTLGYEVSRNPKEGATEVYEALQSDHLDATDPRAITVNWYKKLVSEGIKL